LANGLNNLIKKEVKELLRDPKIMLSMVLMPLLIFPLMGSAMNISTTAVEESARQVTVSLLDMDHGVMAQSLSAAFRVMNVTLVETQATTVDEALDELQNTNMTTLVVIPSGFSQNLTLGLKGSLKVYSVYKSLSIAEQAKTSVVDVPISVFESALVRQAITQAFPGRDPSTVLNPISVSSFSVVKGNVINISPSVLSSLFISQSIGFPMVIMMLLI